MLYVGLLSGGVCVTPFCHCLPQATCPMCRMVAATENCCGGSSSSGSSNNSNNSSNSKPVTFCFSLHYWMWISYTSTTIYVLENSLQGNRFMVARFPFPNYHLPRGVNGVNIVTGCWYR